MRGEAPIHRRHSATVVAGAHEGERAVRESACWVADGAAMLPSPRGEVARRRGGVAGTHQAAGKAPPRELLTIHC